MLKSDHYRGLAAGPVCGLDGTALDNLHIRVDLDDWILRTVHDAAHASGTCAMGSVVDAECRVVGVSGLRVVDMSVAPKIPRANPHLTAVMLGERMGRLLGEASG
jgi:choline dehydrogenase